MPSRNVPPEHDNMDVVDFLAAQFPDRTITGFRRLVGGGHVTVNGASAQACRTVRVGDEVIFPRLDEHVPRFVKHKKPPKILARVDDILAIDKPAGIPVLPEGSGQKRSEAVVNQILSVLDEGERVYPVHRLDKDTSGVLLVATSRRAARELSRAFHDKTVTKQYRAIVRGVMLENEGEIDMPIQRPKRRTAQVRIDFRTGKPALTRFEVVRRFRGFTEVKLYPETGRTHQIRAHLRAIGFPLAVDPLYGSAEGLKLSEFKRGYNAKKGAVEKPLIARLPLHAESIVFPLPESDETLRVESPIPKDMRITLEKLDRWGKMGRGAE